MKLKTLAELLAISAAVRSVAAAPGFAAAGPCRHLGGGILPTFYKKPIAVRHPSASAQMARRQAISGGAVGVAVLAIAGNVLHNHHHWVTDTGDTIFFKDADLTLLPTSIPGQLAGDYLGGIDITGGSGGFEGATGKISAFGAIDENKGQRILRYEGTACFEPMPPP